MTMTVHTHRFDNAHRVLRSIRIAPRYRLLQIDSTLQAFIGKRKHQLPPSLQLQRTEALLLVVRLEVDSRKPSPYFEPNGRKRREAERVYCKLSLMDC